MVKHRDCSLIECSTSPHSCVAFCKLLTLSVSEFPPLSKGIYIYIINIYFKILYILRCFHILGSLLARGVTAPSGVNKHLAWEQAFHMQTHQSKAHIPKHLLYLTLSHQAGISLARILQGPGPGWLETTSIEQGPPKLFKVSNPKSAQTWLHFLMHCFSFSRKPR